MSEDILLQVVSRRRAARALREWDELLVKMELTDRFRLYEKSYSTNKVGIYLSRLSTRGDD